MFNHLGRVRLAIIKALLAVMLMVLALWMLACGLILTLAYYG